MPKLFARAAIILSSLVLATGFVQAQSADKPTDFAQIEKTLQDFQSSDLKATEVMNADLKRSSQGDQTFKIFSDKAISSGKFIAIKNSTRGPIAGKIGSDSNDKVEKLVDVESNEIVISIDDMNKKYRAAKLVDNPWSDTYWPTYIGSTANRYLDKNFINLDQSWKVRFDFFKKFGENDVDVDVLSPAEKYDLLVGDDAKTLTKLAWELGRGQNDTYKTVDEWSWMGLCHGWSPASYMLGRPTGTVKVTAADGKTEITFYPSDIKALATLLWANYAYTARFVGGRCDLQGNQIKTTKAGRVINKECFDTNPETWHKAVVNQIAVAKRSFVLDATFDAQVWNQPVLGYSYSYFNPMTGESTNTLSKATVNYAKFKASGKDKFSKEYDSANPGREPGTVSLVGIAMDLTYIVETAPSDSKTDSARRDATEVVQYMYDLELDADNNIIGGEWYTNKHPDFLWTPAADDRAVSPADKLLKGEWNAAKEAFPAEWTRYAVRASQGQQPLAKAVEALIKASRKKIL